MKKTKNKKTGRKRKTILNNAHQMSVSQIKLKHPTISACMIVKNEEKFLEKCLTSIKEQVDEIIIVDTGSTDNTIDIAKRFTDKVYFHQWENSFCKARNQALQYAKNDWIFQIDADEELIAGNGLTIRRAVVDAEDSDIVFVKIYSTYANGSQKSFHNLARLFRNNGKIHYEENIHEQVIGGTKDYFSSIMLSHYGYDIDETKAEEKFIRNTALLKNEIEKDPENPVHHHNLSVSYLIKEMNEDAVSEAIKAIELSDSQKLGSNLYGWTHFVASMGCYRMGRLEDAKKFAEKSLNKYPEHLDSNYMLAIIAFDEDRWDDVIRYGSTFLKLLGGIDSEKKNVIFENSMNEGSIICTLIGHAYYFKNRLPEMRSCYKTAIEGAGNKWQSFARIGKYHVDKSHDINLAEEYLKLAANEAPDEKAVWYMLAELNKNCGKINEELKCLLNVISIGTTDPAVYGRAIELHVTERMPDETIEIILNHIDKIDFTGSTFCKLAVIQLEKGRLDSAINSYMKALEKDPNLFEAWASLGEIMLAMNKIEDSKNFLERALTIKNNDTGAILNLCDIAARQADIFSVVRYCDTLIGVFNLPNDRTVNHLDELKEIFFEIIPAVKENKYYQNQILGIIDRISQIQDQPC
jgi:glycosyltransferase involved in cell wall biosynthesis